MQQLFRFALVGGLNNGIIYLVYLFLTYCGIVPQIAMTLVYVIGLFFGFVAHKNWTFVHQGRSLDIKLRFLMAHLIGYLINLIILFIFVDYLGCPHQAVQAVSILIVAGFLFTVFKYVVFVKNKAEKT